MGDVLRGFASLLARIALFLGVVGFSGWFLVSGASAESVPAGVYSQEVDQLAAEGVVEGFLQSAQLNQFERAHDYLTASAQTSVSASQLEMMLGALPLSQSPDHWNSELIEEGQKARVMVTRGGACEVYTLVNHNHRWGVASVSLVPVPH